MSEVIFFVIKWAVLTAAFFASLLPTFFKVRDDSHRFTRLGQASLGVAVGAFALGACLDCIQRRREETAQAVAESRSQMKADSRTKHQEEVLRAESDSLKALQRAALLQMDSAAAVS